MDTELGFVLDTVHNEDPSLQLPEFSVDGAAATEAEYKDALAAQDAKPNAVWYDFTEENINAVLG